MKTKEELNAIKDEVIALNRKLAELSDSELNEVYGGYSIGVSGDDNDKFPPGWICIDGVWYHLQENWGAPFQS